jgi:tRNA (Thr-GGU) A37 N-methylase
MVWKDHPSFLLSFCWFHLVAGDLESVQLCQRKENTNVGGHQQFLPHNPNPLVTTRVPLTGLEALEL